MRLSRRWPRTIRPLPPAHLQMRLPIQDKIPRGLCAERWEALPLCSKGKREAWLIFCYNAAPVLSLFASPWIPTLVLFLLAGSARLYSGSWLAPSAFAPMLWSIYVALPLLLAPEYTVSALAVWLIALLVFSIQFGAFLGEQKMPVREQSPRRIPQLANAILAFSGLALVGVIYLAGTTFAANDLPASPLGLLALGHIISVARYAEDEGPWLVRLLVMWVYPAGLLGGMFFAYAQTKKRKLLSFSAFLPALFLGVVSATRSPILITLCCWMAGFLAMKSYLTRGKYRLFTKRLGVIFAGGALAAIGLFIVVDAIRAHDSDSPIEVVADWGRVKSASLGHVAALSEWIKRGSPGYRGYGAYTFSGPYALVGIHARVSGVHEESATVQGGDETNLYTAFRGVVQDFSLFGAVFVCVCFGIFSGRAYRNTISGKPQLAGLAAFYSILLWSPIISLTIYNGLFLAWGVAWYLTRSLRQGPS